jgi:hypothetical protein
MSKTATAEAAPQFTAFAGTRRLGSGDLTAMALKAHRALDRAERAPILIFEDSTGETREIDLRGSAADVRARLLAVQTEPALPLDDAARGRGRPRLGVTAREVTLLPRHWEWLARQPLGASVALRKLVEEARRVSTGAEKSRAAREIAYRVMVTLAGDLPGFEEACRALFRGEGAAFEARTAPWPADVRAYVRQLAAPGLIAMLP